MSRVSVVMPARNAAGTIEAALASVLEAPEVAEVIVVDDQSTDGTADTVRGLGDPRIRLLPGPPEGFPASLNTAFDAVTSPYVARCDADDRFEAARLASQLAWLEAHPDFVAISSAYVTADEQGQQVATHAADGEAREVTDKLRRGGRVTHFCTFLTRIEAIRSIGGLRPWFQTGSDLDLQYRLGGQGRIWHDPTVSGYVYVLHDNSITHRQPDMRRKFFDQSSRLFAQQRLASGEDDLMRGTPPEVPAARQGRGSAPRSTRAQIAGQLESAAWKAYQAGERKDAFRGMRRALRTDPFSPRRWRSLVSMAIKLAARRS